MWLFILFRLIGYANGFAMKDITENDLDGIEHFVKNELLKLLLEKCTRLSTEFSDLDKENFFGLYASSDNEFKLLRGERKLLLKIASHLTELHTKDSDDFKKKFDLPKKFKIGKSEAVETPVGLFYGKKFHKNAKFTELTHPALISLLFAKLKPFLESFTNLKPVRAINKDLIQIIDNCRADIICVFCPSNDCDIEILLKRIVVRYDDRWNFSNFKKHIMNKHVGIKAKSLEITDSIQSDNSFENDEHIVTNFDNNETMEINKSNGTENSNQSESLFNVSQIFDESDILNLPIEYADSSND